jgi:hypothetical protein
MKVKILSMQRVMNYGSFMQAYALKRVVESFGHQVEFCDFRPGEPRHRGEKVRMDGPIENLRKIFRILADPPEFYKKRLFRRHYRKCFELYAWPALGINPSDNYNTESDLLIIGSDEVFNYTQNHGLGYVPVLFGYGVEAPKLISYAASAGYTNIEDIETDGMADTLSEGFNQFSQIGVRDRNTLDIVARYSRIAPVMTLDPTLIYDFRKDVQHYTLAPGYLLIYAYQGRLDSPEEIAEIKNFASVSKVRVVSVGFYHNWCDENLVVKPFELLSLFEQASFVVTDTFHGTIFSILTKKQFVSLLRGENRSGSNANKLAFLLEQLGLDDRINRDLGVVKAQLKHPIDYDRVFRNLSPLREASIKFLTATVNPSNV